MAVASPANLSVRLNVDANSIDFHRAAQMFWMTRAQLFKASLA